MELGHGVGDRGSSPLNLGLASNKGRKNPAGVMGLSMFTHLLDADYSVIVFIRNPSHPGSLLPIGACLAGSLDVVAESSDVVFSIVGFPSDVRSVRLDPSSGALFALSTGGILVEMTTYEPYLARSVSTSSKGRHSGDAPVCGSDRGAKSATLLICVGGEEPIVLN